MSYESWRNELWIFKKAFDEKIMVLKKKKQIWWTENNFSWFCSKKFLSNIKLFEKIAKILVPEFNAIKNKKLRQDILLLWVLTPFFRVWSFQRTLNHIHTTHRTQKTANVSGNICFYTLINLLTCGSLFYIKINRKTENDLVAIVASTFSPMMLPF